MISCTYFPRQYNLLVIQHGGFFMLLELGDINIRARISRGGYYKDGTPKVILTLHYP